MSLSRVIPPGQVDAYCIPCHRDVVIPDGSLACPHCGRDVEPTSLASTPKPISAVPAPTGAVQSIELPDIRQAGAWSRATEALLEALEDEETAAMAAFEAARERVKVARKAANAVRQVRGLVAVQSSNSSAAPRPSAVAPNGKRWSRQHDACANCGTTSVKHAARGRCGTCDKHWRDHGAERVGS